MVNRNLNPRKPEKSNPDSREQAVLSAIIREHLISGEAVGSHTVSDNFAHAAGWSAATIRNVMGQLEESGFLEQPHTSAGRIPTDKGYRFYVDHILGSAKLSRFDLAEIQRVLYGSHDEKRLEPDR